MVYPEHLQKVVQDGYYVKTLDRCVLQKLDEPFVHEEQDSIEDALAEIEKNVEKLKNKSLTILPIICVNYEEKIS